MTELLLSNRQRTRRVDLRLLRRIATGLLMELIRVHEFELGIHLVAPAEMSRINRQFLRHEGSTDVITFDHAENAKSASNSRLHGELYICLDDVLAHARRFRVDWPSEIVRCLVHGVLHLRGFDDSTPTARREMKRVEARLLHELEARFSLSRLAKRSAIPRTPTRHLESQGLKSRRRFPLSKPRRKPTVAP
jgi:rRNA maturation RNase YbeY